jgi:hypothetical protein
LIERAQRTQESDVDDTDFCNRERCGRRSAYLSPDNTWNGSSSIVQVLAGRRETIVTITQYVLAAVLLERATERRRSDNPAGVRPRAVI